MKIIKPYIKIKSNKITGACEPLSDFLEAHELEEPECAVMPQSDPSVLRDSRQLCSNNVRQALEVLLASGKAFLVQLA